MAIPDSQRFEAQLGRKPFLVTMEVNPPKGTDVTGIVQAVERVRGLVDAINVTDGSGAIIRAGPHDRGLVDAINVTDGSGAIMRASPVAIAKVVLDAGVDPILQ